MSELIMIKLTFITKAGCFDSIFSYPVSEIVGEHKISWEGLCKGFVKLENLQKFVPIDQVDITVGEGANVDRGLTDLGIAPERIPENVTFAWKRLKLTEFVVEQRFWGLKFYWSLRLANWKPSGLVTETYFCKISNQMTFLVIRFLYVWSEKVNRDFFDLN